MPCADALTTNPCHDSQGWDKLESTQLTKEQGAIQFCGAYSNHHLYCWEDGGPDQCGHSVPCPAIQGRLPDSDSAYTQATRWYPTPACPNLGASNTTSAAALGGYRGMDRRDTHDVSPFGMQTSQEPAWLVPVPESGL